MPRTTNPNLQAVLAAARAVEGDSIQQRFASSSLAMDQLHNFPCCPIAVPVPSLRREALIATYGVKLMEEVRDIGGLPFKVIVFLDRDRSQVVSYRRPANASDAEPFTYAVAIPWIALVAALRGPRAIPDEILDAIVTAETDGDESQRAVARYLVRGDSNTQRDEYGSYQVIDQRAHNAYYEGGSLSLADANEDDARRVRQVSELASIYVPVDDSVSPDDDTNDDTPIDDDSDDESESDDDTLDDILGDEDDAF